MKSGYQQRLKDLVRISYSACLTMDVIALFLFSLLLLVVAVVCGIMQQNNQNILPIFIISLAVGVLGFFGSSIWYLMKTRDLCGRRALSLSE
jgi:ABC-type multidrug transport system permease subunit